MLGTWCSAENLQINKDGVVRAETEQWRSLTPLEMEAYNNPGKKIPYHYSYCWTERVGFLYGVMLKESPKKFFYDGALIKTLDEKSVVKGDPFFLWYVPSLLFVVVMMLYVRWKSSKNELIFLVAGVATLVITIGSISTLVITYAVFSFLAGMVALLAVIVASESKSEKVFSILNKLSIAYYILCGLALFVW